MESVVHVCDCVWGVGGTRVNVGACYMCDLVCGRACMVYVYVSVCVCVGGGGGGVLVVDIVAGGGGYTWDGGVYRWLCVLGGGGLECIFVIGCGIDDKV